MRTSSSSTSSFSISCFRSDSLSFRAANCAGERFFFSDILTGVSITLRLVSNVLMALGARMSVLRIKQQENPGVKELSLGPFLIRPQDASATKLEHVVRQFQPRFQV
jgi:hypothetical protein